MKNNLIVASKMTAYASVIFLFILFLPLNANPDLKILKSDENEIIFCYKPTLSGFDTIFTKDGSLTLYPLITEAFNRNANSGQPVELAVKFNITVPDRNSFSVEKITVNGTKSIPSLLTPVPTIENIYEFAYNSIDIDNLNYSKAINSDLVEVKYGGIARNRHLADIYITVARFNNNSSAIEIPKEVIVKISFKKPNVASSINLSNEDDLVTSINHYQTKNWLVEPVKIKPLNSELKNQKILSETEQWAKITVGEEGIYRITADMLSNIGINITKELVPTIKIYGNGGVQLSEAVTDGMNNQMNEQAIIVKTNNDGSLESIVFYGAAANGFIYTENSLYHFVNSYSDNNSYILVVGGSEGKRASAVPAPGNEATFKPITYSHFIFYEEAINNAYINGSGRTWYGRTIFPCVFTNQLLNLDREGTITYRLGGAQRYSDTASFSVFENNNLIATIRLSNYGDSYRNEKTVSVPANKIASDNRSVLKFQYSMSSDASATAFFDFYEIRYPRSFVAINNELSFFSKAGIDSLTEYTINGFQGDLIGFDLTKIYDPQLLTNLATTGGMFIFKKQESKSPSRYFISGNLKTPSLSKIETGTIRTNYQNAELIIVTHPTLLESAKEFADYRSKKSNIKVDVVTNEQIYNEFNGGVPDVTAVRDYISFAFRNWEVKPKYVLLWGDGHFDFKNIQTKETNFCPPYETADEMYEFDAIASYACDDYFVIVFGDDYYIDLAIGRLPVYSNENGKWMCKKIKLYEESSSKENWRTFTTLLADDSWAGGKVSPDGPSHTNQSETLSNTCVPNDIQQKKIYLAEYPIENQASGIRKPRVTEELITAVNQNGTLLLNWTGHGNPRVWAHEEILERSKTIPLMKNLDKLFFCFGATCDFGRFDLPEVRSGTEELVISKVGGAIGVYSASRSVYATANAALNQQFYNALFARNEITKKYPTIGEAFFISKINRTDHNDKKYNLFCDPSLSLLLPHNIVLLDSINGKSLVNNSEPIELKALSNVEIKGRIVDPVDSSKLISFNGLAVINMYDTDLKMSVVDRDGTIYNYSKTGGAVNRSSCKVNNGDFSTNFIIPKDISFSNKQGKFYIYAYSNDNTELYAKGYSNRFMLGGIDTLKAPDQKGPEIKIFMESRKFSNGDYVSSTPLLIVDLLDESGVNATGYGIGHRIEAWIDDDPDAIDLTSKYVTSSEDSRYGSAEQILMSLKSGTHKVKVRAWDVFNNDSIAEADFKISDVNDGIVLTNINNFPNPFEEAGTKFEFNHNLAEQFNVEIEIFTVTGMKVKSIYESISSNLTAEIPWDGLDDDQKSISSGVYVYNIKVSNSKGLNTKKTGIMVCIK